MRALRERSQTDSPAHTLMNDAADLIESLAARVADLEDERAAIWDTGYKAGRVDGYYETHEEKNPYRKVVQA